MVKTESMISLIISIAIAIIIPIVLTVYFKKKYKISLKVLLVGALTFFLFVQVLEGLVPFVVFNNGPASSLLENPWAYMLYGGLMAGIFEETGRFLMFSFLLKKYRECKDGLAFGLGHGGLESVMIVGITNITMLAYAFMINNGTFDKLLINQQTKDALQPVKQQLISEPSYLYLLGGIERISAIAFQIALSLLVLYAVKENKKVYLLYAIGIHALLNFPAALYQKDVITNIFIIEIFYVFIAVGAIMWIRKSRKLFSNPV
ncbi:YhfC family intramembrane metalloprotease [Bacillus sp. V59.32b]|uniref:YhfC family intramembrane metalloprotease n=1 Tax=Bacillus sp. V59.32b TaxID=1758642 RepID=UPI000E3C910C|nr:YhfC family intramembrane metalloprotease [Bacillus sp. V59.32b]RFU63065.1 DUF2324 domain-containing protein [Bacillus sp. V59.32b]